MSSGGPKYETTGSTTSTAEPWVAAQPHLKNIMKEAQQLYNTDTGYKPYQGQTLANINPQLQSSFGQIKDIAKNNQLPGQVTDFAQQTLTGGGAPSASQNWATGAMSANVVPGGATGTINNLMKNGVNMPGQVQGILGNIGQTGGTSNQSNAYLRDILGGSETSRGGSNPFMKQMLNTNAARIQDQMASTMAGAGRYGSFGHADALANSIAEANNPLLAQTYENAMGRQMQAAGQLNTNMQNQASTQLGATGQMAANAQNEANTQFQAANLASNNAFANQQAQLAGAGLSNMIDQAQAGRQMQTMAMAPQLNELQYADANRLGTIGQYMQGRDQAQIDAKINKWNQNQARPWENLARYAGTVGGMGTQGGTKTATTQAPQAPFGQSVLGGAITGASLGSMFGPWGVGLGTLGGGILSAFS